MYLNHGIQDTLKFQTGLKCQQKHATNNSQCGGMNNVGTRRGRLGYTRRTLPVRERLFMFG